MRDRFFFLAIIVLLLFTLNVNAVADTNAPYTQFVSSQISGTTDQNIMLYCSDNNTGCKYINYNIDNLGWNIVTIKSIYSDANLKAYYKFDETSGTTLIDYKGFDNNGTNTNVTLNNVGKIGKSYFYNGSGVTNLTNTTFPTTKFSIATWVKATNVGVNKILFMVGSYGSTQIEIYQNEKLGCAFGTGDGVGLNSTKVLNDNNWHFVVCTYDGTTGRMWFDNNFVGSQSKAMTVGTTTPRFSYNSDANIFIDETSIWDKNLTSNEITQLYNSGNGLIYPTTTSDNNFYLITFTGVGDHNIQYFSTDNADNNETTKFSQFPAAFGIGDISNSRILFYGVDYYNGYQVTNWDWNIDGAKFSDEEDPNYYTSSANTDFNVCLTMNLLDTYCYTQSSWDTIEPTIDANVSFTKGFVSYFDVNYSMQCFDNKTPVNYQIILNDSNVLYNSWDANASSKSGTIRLGEEESNLVFKCVDAWTNEAIYTADSIYSMQFKLINEETGAQITDLNILEISFLKAYTYDGNTNFDYNVYSAVLKYFMDYDNVLRFEITYKDVLTTKVSREIDFGLVEDVNVNVCVAKFQQFYEQFIYSTQNKDVVLYNDFAKCYNLASETKFAWENALMVRAFTINRPYYLYTYSNAVKVLLAVIDGSKENLINLDSLEFNETDYSINIAGDTVVFKCLENNLTHVCDQNIFTIYYKSLRGTNSSALFQIYNNNALLWSYNELTDPNEFQINFFYGDYNIDSNTMLKLKLTTVAGGESNEQEFWFNSEGASYSGVFNPYLAVIFSFLLLFVGLTLVAYRFAFGWFGIILCIISIAMLSMAPGFWWVQFMQVVICIVGVFIFIIFGNETKAVN